MQITIDPRLRSGAWADWWKVRFTGDGFTVDFGIREPDTPGEVVLVARLFLPTRGPFGLMEELGQAWLTARSNARVLTMNLGGVDPSIVVRLGLR